jgi:hypothetical protein
MRELNKPKLQVPKFKSQQEIEESKKRDEENKLNTFINEMQSKYS